MTFRRSLFFLTFALVCAAAAVPARTVAAAAAPDAAQCRQVDDPQTRLACYDRLHGRDSGDTGEAAKPISSGPDDPTDDAPDAEPAAAARDEPRPDPAGRTPAERTPAERNPTAQRSGGEAGHGGDGAPIVSRVAEIGETPTGRTWFRLEDGRVWQQVTPRRTGIEAGNTVRVMETAIGSWHLRRADGSSRSTQVRRVE